MMESNSSSLLRNSIFVFLSLAIRAITSFLIGVGIARFYGPESFGQFSIAFTVSNICLILADFGFDVLLTTEIANNRKNAVDISRKYFSIKIALALVSSVVMISLTQIIPLSETSKQLIFSLVLYMALTTIINFFFSFFRGFEKFDFETKVSFYSNSILLISIALFGFLKFSLFYLMIFFVFTRFIGVLLSYFYSRKIVNVNFWELDFSESNLLLKKVFIYGLNFLFGNLFFQIDTILVGSLLGDTAAGIYRSAFWVMILFLMIPDIAISASLPSLSKAFVEDKNEWKKLGKVIFKLLLVIVIPISLLIYFYPDFIITTIYGKIKFNNAIAVLQIFAFTIFVRFIVEPFGLMITTSQRQYIRTIIVIIATFANVGLNFYFVPKYGLMAVPLISLVVNIFVGLGYIAGSFDSFLNWVMEFKILFLLVITSLFISGLVIFNHYYLVMILLTLIYFPVAFIFTFSTDEKKYLLSTFSLRKIPL